MKSSKEFFCCLNKTRKIFDFKSNCAFINPYIQLVPENTVKKGTSKFHKTDEKASILQCTFIHQYLKYFETIRPLHPAPFQKCSGIISKIPTSTEKRAPPFCQYFSILVPTQKISSLCSALVFSFILVYTRVRQMRN